MRLNARKILLFLGITFALDWLLAGLFAAFGGGLDNIAAARVFLLVGVLYMFMPMVSAILVQRIYREPIKGPLGISFKLNKWWLVAWLLPPTIALLTFVVSLAFPDVHFSPDMSGILERFRALVPPDQLAEMQEMVSQALPAHVILLLVQALIAGATINAVAGFGEELGWRGFLLRELAPLGFWRSSIAIGLIWGIWHAPIILMGHNYPQHPRLGVLMMTVWTLLLSPVFSYIRLQAQSVIAAAILHGTLNATYGLAIVYVAGGSDLVVGLTGVAGFILLAIANVGMYLYDTRVAARKVMRPDISDLLPGPTPQV